MRLRSVLCGCLAMVTWTLPASAGITVTGSPADKTDFANMLTAIMGAQVTIAADGSLSIAAGGNTCAALLSFAIHDTIAVTLDVGRNQDGVFTGGFHPTGPNGSTSGTQSLDLDDLDMLGDDNTSGTVTKGSAIMHEIWEVLYSKRTGKNYTDSHKYAVEDCENLYFFAMSNTPTARVCGNEVIRGNPNFGYTWYLPTKRGDGTRGWCCVPGRRTGDKDQIDGPPTFVPGVNPPQGLSRDRAGAMAVAAVSLQGPLKGVPCATTGVPILDLWREILLAVLLAGTAVLLLRRGFE